MIDFTFPIATYHQVINDIKGVQRALEKEKADWQLVRNTLSKSEAKELDAQFKELFIELGSSNYKKETLQQMYDQLLPLVQRGASASTLDDHELSRYNLAMFIDDLHNRSGEEAHALSLTIIRMAIVANANMATQKIYVGNGGVNSLTQMLEYLARGVRDRYGITTIEQYQSCYTVFTWIVSQENAHTVYVNPYQEYLACLGTGGRQPNELYNGPGYEQIAICQRNIIMMMMHCGFSPFASAYMSYMGPTFFINIINLNVAFFALLLPYEHKELVPYIELVKESLTADVMGYMVQGFTGNPAGRKLFKTLFAKKKHWLLEFIMTTMPEFVFSLAKRGEQELLAVFLKHYRSVLMNHRDANGNTLLHMAVLNVGLANNTILFLRSAGFSLQAVNNEGLTPLALAQKRKKKKLIPLLQ